MISEAIRELLAQEPFEAFELITSVGDRLVVKDPTHVVLLPGQIVVTDPAAERLAVLSLNFVIDARIISNLVDSERDDV